MKLSEFPYERVDFTKMEKDGACEFPEQHRYDR